jgi:fermentation-respiration switch protein FrsA (DUF1100 family)
MMPARTMAAFHPFLVSLYIVLPLAAAALALVRARRERSMKPVIGFVLHCGSSAVVAITACVVFGRAAGLHVPLSQYALAAYLLIGVLSVLWGVSWLLRQAIDRLLYVHPAQHGSRPRGGDWVARATVAILLRSALLFAIGLPYLMAIGLVYRPRGVGGPGPAAALPGAVVESVDFQATDGTRLSGWWIPARPALPGERADATWGRKTVIVCHGWGATRGDHLGLARQLWPHGYNVLAFDFRAHGQSGGQTTSFGDRERYDVLGAVRWLKSARPAAAGRIVGVGMTTGAVALLAAAADESSEGHAIDAVALFGPYDQFSRITTDALSLYASPPVQWMVETLGLPLAGLHAGSDLKQFSPAEYVDRIAPRPVLVVHARADGLISFDAGRRVYEQASQPRYRLWVGEVDAEGRLVIPRNTSAATTQPAAGEGLPAQHHNLIYDDAALRAVWMWFELAQSSV